MIAPIVISMPLWITSGTEPDFPWLRGKLTAAGWVPGAEREPHNVELLHETA